MDGFSISLFSSLLLILSFHLQRTDVGFVHVVYMSREFSVDHRIANRSTLFPVDLLRGTIMSPQPGFTFCDLTMISTAKRVIILPVTFKPVIKTGRLFFSSRENSLWKSTPVQ